jgi:hypothetical protein
MSVKITQAYTALQKEKEVLKSLRHLREGRGTKRFKDKQRGIYTATILEQKRQAAALAAAAEQERIAAAPRALAIICDYLEINLRGKFVPVHSERFTFTQKEIGTKFYRDVYAVSLDGKPFGLLQCNPRMRTIPPDSIVFKVDNQQLYLQDTGYVLSQFVRITGLLFKSVARLDVACDFHNFEFGSVDTFVKMYMRQDVERKGRVLEDFAPHFKGLALQGVSFGSRSSDRFGRLYNKTQLLQKENKPYITAFHESNNLVGADVWRLEFTLKGKEVKRLFRPVMVNQEGREAIPGLERAYLSEHELLSPDLLRGVFHTEMMSYFCFVESAAVTGIEARRNRPSIKLLDTLRPDMGKPPVMLSRVHKKTEVGGKNHRYRIAVKTSIREYFATGDVCYLDVALRYIQSYNLHWFVQKRFKYWLKEFDGYQESYEYADVLTYLLGVGSAMSGVSPLFLLQSDFATVVPADIRIPFLD